MSTTAVPRQHLVQHPDPDAPRRLHGTEHVDPAGVEEPCVVFIDPGDETGGPTSICLDLKVDLGPAQAREVGARLIELADQLTPASPDALWPLRVALDAINEKGGTSHTLESVAESLGIDPAGMTKADTSRIAEHIGGVLMR